MAVYWKGIDLKSYGIIVDKTPTISKGKKNIDTISIPGRNGFLTIDKGTYQPFVVSLECHARESANYDKMDMARYHLMGKDNILQLYKMQLSLVKHYNSKDSLLSF